MNKLNKLALLVAGAALAGSVFANGSTTASDNWRTGHGNLQWKIGNASGLCWRTAGWTPATAAPGCDGGAPAMVAKPAAPVMAPAPVVAAAPAAAAPVAAPAAAKPAAAATKVTYAADAFFTPSNAVLKPAGKAKLDDLIAKLKGINLEVIVAVGHAATGEKNAQALSVKRAEAVKAYLVSKGVEKNRVYTEGKGDKQPVADNKTKEGQAKNRRVEIEVVGTRAAK
jgi:OOP family OmpA-OmpF porin